MKYDYAVYIGRFQPFHNGHLATILYALTEADKVIVILGSSNAAPNIKNPFTVADRIKMISSSLQREDLDRVTFKGVRDYLYSDEKWVNEVYNTVTGIVPRSAKVALVGYHKDSSSYYLDLFPNWHFIHMPPVPNVDATTVRQLLFEGKGYAHLIPEGVGKWLKGFTTGDYVPAERGTLRHRTRTYKELQEEFFTIRDYRRSWSGTPYPPTFVTVDAVVTQGGHVLVVTRKDHPGKGYFALPGGFIRENDTLKQSLIRELKEETSIVLPETTLENSIIEWKVFDNPNRSTRGRTITHAAHIRLTEKLPPSVIGGDDAATAKWMPVFDVYRNEERFFEDHVQIIDYFCMKN